MFIVSCWSTRSTMNGLRGLHFLIALYTTPRVGVLVHTAHSIENASTTTPLDPLYAGRSAPSHFTPNHTPVRYNRHGIDKSSGSVSIRDSRLNFRRHFTRTMLSHMFETCEVFGTGMSTLLLVCPSTCTCTYIPGSPVMVGRGRVIPGFKRC